MEGETLNIQDVLLTLLKSPMLKFDPAQYFERATLVFMQFSAMNQKVNANHALLQKVLGQLENCNHLLRKIQKRI
jgi:hypothetical protein